MRGTPLSAQSASMRAFLLLEGGEHVGGYRRGRRKCKVKSTSKGTSCIRQMSFETRAVSKNSEAKWAN
eukprot:12881261-Prorocentrum_lima.AAC.1